MSGFLLKKCEHAALAYSCVMGCPEASKRTESTPHLGQRAVCPESVNWLTSDAPNDPAQWKHIASEEEACCDLFFMALCGICDSFIHHPM